MTHATQLCQTLGFSLGMPVSAEMEFALAPKALYMAWHSGQI
jgi:hypothetical protein